MSGNAGGDDAAIPEAAFWTLLGAFCAAFFGTFLFMDIVMLLSPGATQTDVLAGSALTGCFIFSLLSWATWLARWNAMKSVGQMK